MSKRGRRRNSRRKSSSSSKQSVPPYNLQKQNNQNSVNFKDENVEKGETDSFRKENVQSGSEEEEKNIKDPEGEKNIKGGPPLKASPSQRTIYRKTSEDTERGVKIVTSVSVSDVEDSSTSIIFQQSHGPLPEGPTRPVTNVMTISCSGSHLKLEIQEFLQHHPCGTKTVFSFVNGADSLSNSDGQRRWTPSERPSSRLSSPCGDKTTSGPTVTCDRQNYPSDRRQPASGEVLFGDRPLLSTNLQEKRRRFFRSFSSDRFWDVPPPQEFSDLHSNSLEDLTPDPASRTTRWPFSGEAAFFDQLSESDNYEPMFMRPCSSTNRESFTEDFINYQKRRSWIRNNSIAAVEHRDCWFPMKRSQTFPGMPEGLPTIRDPLLPDGESLSSLISLPLQSEEQGGPKFSAFRAGSYGSFSETPKSQYGNAGSPESDCRWRSDPIVVADRGFDQEMVEVEHYGPEPLLEKVHEGALTIHVIPPSCSGSEEHMLQSHPAPSAHDEKVEDGSQEEEVPVPAKQNKSSVQTITVGANEQRLLQPGSGSSAGGFMGKDVEDPSRSLLKDQDVHPSTTKQDTEEERGGRGAPEGPDKPECPTKSCDIQPMETLSNPNTAVRSTLSRSSSDSKAHLKPVPHKDPDSSEHWAKRRKLFKESKQWSSAGGSSITSDITEESVSEETRSMDLMIQDNEDRGFYTQTFHSSAWIYQSRDVGSPTDPPSLDASTRTASVRERTVRISKGSGEYPWGFRIQFSKPIVVTEVDTNGAAEEAGLMVGDFVLAVNGTDVTSIPHSEAADLARQDDWTDLWRPVCSTYWAHQGANPREPHISCPDLLTLTIGSDIARCPNTPRPSCRGYLHKRTQSGLIKGWRKRWFVLTYDCCLYYYRHKRDEGKRRALSAVKLEGAEVGPDVSLGKPFVFKCRPQSADRVFFFCTTSNQEMKRWLEAMEKAVHPNTQNHVWEDVTRHNSCLPPLAVKNPECLGLLHRMDKSRETWVQHYCILKDGCLYFYSSIRATHAHGGIYLQGYVVRDQTCGSKKSTIELKPPSEEFKTFFFSAENPDENKRWITAIKASVKNWLPFHQLLQDYRNRPAEETRM